MAELLEEWDRTESAKVAKCVSKNKPPLCTSDRSPRITFLNNAPPSTSGATMDKPHGLANAKRGVPTTNTIIEDFVYPDETDDTQSDEELEDGLEYPGSAPESLVRPFSDLSQ